MKLNQQLRLFSYAFRLWYGGQRRQLDNHQRREEGAADTQPTKTADNNNKHRMIADFSIWNFFLSIAVALF